jgi:antitoxin MazE
MYIGMQVSKWGNSLAIRIPAAVAEELKLKPGDEVSVKVTGASEFAVERKMTREEAVELIRKGGLRLPKGFRFNRREANARPGLL